MSSNSAREAPTGWICFFLIAAFVTLLRVLAGSRVQSSSPSAIFGLPISTSVEPT
jgi:hypothetical protein